MYLCHHTNPINDITATLCMISHPLYVRHSVHYIDDIIPTMYDNTTLCVDYITLGACMTSFALQKTSHTLCLSESQSLWFHIHVRHDITPPVSDITPTVSLSSQSLNCYHTQFCMTSHTLYVWYHMHYALYITWYPLLMSSHYSAYDSTTLTYEATSSIHHPFDITVTSLCHHTHCFQIITPTFCMTSHMA